jgi:hypothetical protein
VERLMLVPAAAEEMIDGNFITTAPRPPPRSGRGGDIFFENSSSQPRGENPDSRNRERFIIILIPT